RRARGRRSRCRSGSRRGPARATRDGSCGVAAETRAPARSGDAGTARPPWRAKRVPPPWRWAAPCGRAGRACRPDRAHRATASRWARWRRGEARPRERSLGGARRAPPSLGTIRQRGVAVEQLGILARDVAVQGVVAGGGREGEPAGGVACERDDRVAVPLRLVRWHEQPRSPVLDAF